MAETPAVPTDRRALLAGIGGLAAGTFLLNSRAEAGSLTPPGAPAPTGKPLGEVEPRVAVNAINTPANGSAVHVISQPGSYYLTSNIAVDFGQTGIEIDASNVTLDLNGFSIIGPGSASTFSTGLVVAENGTDIVIHNGNIAEINNAVYGFGSPGRVCVRNVHVRNAESPAIGLTSQCILEDCTFINCWGISVGNDCRVSRCLVHAGHGIAAGPRSVVESCQVSGTMSHGILVIGGVVEGNVVVDCAMGIYVGAGSNSVFRNNTVLNNVFAGLRVDTAGNTVSGNTVRGNGANYEFVAGNHLDLLISQIPQTLSWPCSAKLQGTLTGVAGQSGITIVSDDVSIDLGGHALVGASNADVDCAAILAILNPLDTEIRYYTGITVRNGSVRNWFRGVYVPRSRGALIQGVSAVDCLDEGFRGHEAAVFQDCTAVSCEVGFQLFPGLTTGC
jgi:parallel beta-helix repeat protein